MGAICHAVRGAEGGAGQQYYTAAGSIVGCALRHFLYRSLPVVQGKIRNSEIIIRERERERERCQFEKIMAKIELWKNGVEE